MHSEGNRDLAMNDTAVTCDGGWIPGFFGNAAAEIRGTCDAVLERIVRYLPEAALFANENFSRHENESTLQSFQL